MTFREMISAEDPTIRINQAVWSGKELFGANTRPYTFKDSIEGRGDKIVFDKHFVETVITALSIECVSLMSYEEKSCFYDYLTYLGSVINSTAYAPKYNTKKIVVEALDALVQEGIPEYDVNQCYSAGLVWRAE